MPFRRPLSTVSQSYQGTLLQRQGRWMQPWLETSAGAFRRLSMQAASLRATKMMTWCRESHELPAFLHNYGTTTLLCAGDLPFEPRRRSQSVQSVAPLPQAAERRGIPKARRKRRSARVHMPTSPCSGVGRSSCFIRCATQQWGHITCVACGSGRFLVARRVLEGRS